MPSTKQIDAGLEWLLLGDAAQVAGVNSSRLRQMIGQRQIPSRELKRDERGRWHIRRRACQAIAARPQTQGWPRGKRRKRRRPC